MAYNIGDKFIIEIKGRVTSGGRSFFNFETISGGLFEDDLDQLPQLVNGVDMASYNKGMEMAFDMLHKVYEMETADREECFADVGHGTGELWDLFENATVHEVLKKLDAWQNKIKVGDEVTFDGIVHMVIKINEEMELAKIMRNDGFLTNIKTELLIKTGNNYAAELRELLNKIGGESE